MAHRAKHLRRNWPADRIAKSQERQKVDDARKAECAKRRLDNQVGVKR